MPIHQGDIVALIGAIKKALFRLLMAPSRAAASWKSYLPKLYAGQRPEGFDEHRRKVVASLCRPGYARAFSLTTRTDHGVAEAHLRGVSVSNDA